MNQQDNSNVTPLQCRALVVGGGPAGATAARLLAANGLDTILIDTESFPRNKPCGGTMPAMAFEGLPFSQADVGALAIPRVSLSISGRECANVALTSPMLSVTRTIFDNALYLAAVSSGARFIVARAQSAVRKGGKWLVTAGENIIACEMLICCDGASGVFSKQFRTSIPSLSIPCYETTVECPNLASDNLAKIDLKFTSDFYAWALPKGNGVFSVGFGGAASNSAFKRPDSVLDMFLGDIRYRVHRREWCGIRLFCAGAKDYARDGVYLCGEAGALVDPVLGEGIRYAIRSAEMCADAILSGKGEGWYSLAIANSIGANFEKSEKLSERFRAIPKIALSALVRLERGRKLIGYFPLLLSGEIDYLEMYRRYKSDKKE